MTALRILHELAGGKSIQTIECEPHIRCASSHEDARGRAQAQHALHRRPQDVAQRQTVEHRNQPPQLGRIEARLDLDAKTIGEHDPKLPARLHAPRSHQALPSRTILNDLDGNNLFPISGQRNTPAPRIERMHAQPT